MMWKVLIPFDGSRHAQAALAHVVALAHKGLAVHAVLVNVQPPPTLLEAVRLHDAEQLTALRTDAGADLLAPAQAALDAAGVRWESEVAGGEPVDVLIEIAENNAVDAIVLGARGVDDADKSGLGVVAHALLERATVPVTLARAAA